MTDSQIDTQVVQFAEEEIDAHLKKKKIKSRKIAGLDEIHTEVSSNVQIL